MERMEKWRKGELSDSEVMTYLIDWFAEVTLEIRRKEEAQANAMWERIGVDK